MSSSGDYYPPIEPYRHGMLVVDSIHTIYWEECGNPAGVPVIFLHGGPGAGCNPNHRRFFDPQRYRIVLFDQRGAGRSTPHGEVTNNTPAHLVADIEALRQMLGVTTWHVFGGSWGATLALVYSQAHPEACLSVTLRGVFLMRGSEVEWFVRGLRQFAPEAWRNFVHFLPEAARDDICAGYWAALNDPDPARRLAAARSWATYEARNVSLRPSAEVMAEVSDNRIAVGLARMEVHYMLNNRFEPDDLLLRRIDRVRHLPCAIVQGRYDLLCPPVAALEVHEAWPGSTLQIIEDAGHAASEPGIRAALVRIMDQRVASA
ncbi:MAG: prolyl aminopeptidase [Gammaproteobacteria bacterium]